MMKRWISLLLALLLSLAWGSAMASPADATVWYASAGSAGDGFLNSAVLWGRTVCCFVEGAENSLILYDLDSRKSRTVSLEDAVELLDYPEGFDPETDDPDELEEMFTSMIEFWFVWDGRLLAVVSSYPEDSEIPQGGRLAELSLEGGAASWKEAELPRLDWSVMLEESGGLVGSRAVEGAFCVGDRLCVQTWDDEGQGLLCLFSLRDGQTATRSVEGLLASAPGPEGTIAILREREENERTLSLWNPDTGEETVRSTAALTDMTPMNLCWREADRTLYFTALGEIWAAPEGDLTRAAAVNDCPVNGSSVNAEITEEGLMLLRDARSVVLRDTDPAKRQNVALKIRDYAELDAIDRANFAFTAARGDVSVSVDRDSPRSQLLQSMLNRDDTADIFCLDLSTSEYTALRDRGYMAPLDGSEKLTEWVGKMYPAAADAVRKDGVLLALPVHAWGYTVGLHPAAMEKLGMTEADRPTTWIGFFDWLQELPARLDGTGVRAFPARMTVGALRQSLLEKILSGWRYAGIAETYDAPELRETLERLDAVDFEALGVAESAQEESGTRSDAVLIDTGAPLTMKSYAGDPEPLLLSFREGAKDPGAYHVAAAFVNPYSKHLPEAIAFLECLADHTEPLSAYVFSPENNTPLRTADYAQSRQSLADSLEAAQAQARGAKDEADRASWEAAAESMEKSLKQMDETWWDISPEAIASFQARADRLVPMTWDVSLLAAESGDASLSEALARFRQGEGTAVDLLEEFDRVYRMKQAEEN